MVCCEKQGLKTALSRIPATITLVKCPFSRTIMVLPTVSTFAESQLQSSRVYFTLPYTRLPLARPRQALHCTCYNKAGRVGNRKRPT